MQQSINFCNFSRLTNTNKQSINKRLHTSRQTINRDKTYQQQTRKKVVTVENVQESPKQNVFQKAFDDLKFNSWAPELINGRCAMLGYTAGYGYEAVTHESLSNQALDLWPAFVLVSLLVTTATLTYGKPSNDDVSINGLTPSAELFNGRAAMIGFVSTLIYEIGIKHSSTI